MSNGHCMLCKDITEVTTADTWIIVMSWPLHNGIAASPSTLGGPVSTELVAGGRQATGGGHYRPRTAGSLLSAS